MSAEEEFKQLSPSEFFYRNREIAGFNNPGRATYQTVRELVENALDATEVHGILPEVFLRVSREDDANPDFVTIQVEDNGIGIPPQFIPDAFGRVLYSSKYRLRQTRGMFGLGAKMAVLYAQITTGKPCEVYSSTRRSRHVYFYRLMIDVNLNEPQVLEVAVLEKRSEWHGTIVRLTIEGEWSKRVRDYVVTYLKRTAVVSPYARFVALLPGVDGGKGQEVLVFDRATTKLPRPPKDARPHPKGVDMEMLRMMLRRSSCSTVFSFLVNEFQRIGETTASRILQKASIDGDKKPGSLTEEEMASLLRAMREERIRPPSDDPLSPIGEELIEIGLKQAFKPEFVATASRRPSSYSGHPFVVEGGIAYGGELTGRLDEVAKEAFRAESGPYVILLRYANKIPLLYDEKADLLWSIVDPSNFPWKSVYRLDPSDTVLVLVHICSTKVPYKGVGKESIAHVDEVEREAKLLVQDLARRLRSYIVAKKREEEARRRLSVFLRYAMEVALDLSVIAGGGRAEPNERLRSLIEEQLRRLVTRKLGLEG